MRILGFSKKWDKLEQLEFTTFRFPRKDKDWFVGEEVQIVIKPRQKGGGEKLGIAEIIAKAPKTIGNITEKEANIDGFYDRYEMWEFLKCPDMDVLVNKLTLRRKRCQTNWLK